jgi:N-acetylmuramoyl-L-alanine amidase
MKIALLNAHTAYAPGAVQELSGQPTSEYYWSNKVNHILLDIINTDYPESGSAIIDTSNVKPYPKSLRYKAHFVKRDYYDIAVETHLNSAIAASASGIEVLYSNIQVPSKDLALCVATSLNKHLPFKLRSNNGIIERDGLYILTATTCPCIIVESLFLSNPTDKLYLTLPRSADIIAYGIYEGLLNYNKLKGGI